MGGFPADRRAFRRHARAAGSAHYTYGKVLPARARRNLFPFPACPCAWRPGSDFGRFGLSLAGVLFTLAQRIFSRWFATIGWAPLVPGFATIVVSVLFLGGVQLICIGILGEYLGRIYRRGETPAAWVIGAGRRFGSGVPPCKMTRGPVASRAVSAAEPGVRSSAARAGPTRPVARTGGGWRGVRDRDSFPRSPRPACQARVRQARQLSDGRSRHHGGGVTGLTRVSGRQPAIGRCARGRERPGGCSRRFRSVARVSNTNYHPSSPRRRNPWLVGELNLESHLCFLPASMGVFRDAGSGNSTVQNRSPAVRSPVIPANCASPRPAYSSGSSPTGETGTRPGAGVVSPMPGAAGDRGNLAADAGDQVWAFGPARCRWVDRRAPLRQRLGSARGRRAGWVTSPAVSRCCSTPCSPGLRSLGVTIVCGARVGKLCPMPCDSGRFRTAGRRVAGAAISLAPSPPSISRRCSTAAPAWPTTCAGSSISAPSARPRPRCTLGRHLWLNVAIPDSPSAGVIEQPTSFRRALRGAPYCLLSPISKTATASPPMSREEIGAAMYPRPLERIYGRAGTRHIRDVTSPHSHRATVCDINFSRKSRAPARRSTISSCDNGAPYTPTNAAATISIRVAAEVLSRHGPRNRPGAARAELSPDRHGLTQWRPFATAASAKHGRPPPRD